MSYLKLSLIMICSALISTVALATPSIYGNWGTSMQLGPMKVTLKMGIEENVTHITSICEQDGKRAKVSVDAPTKIEGNQYTTLSVTRNEISENGINCNVESFSGTMTFSVTDTNLIFQDPELGKLTLTRIN